MPEVKFIHQHVEVTAVTPLALERIARTAGTCFGKDHNFTYEQALGFVHALVRKGHLSPLRFASVDATILTSRAIAAELMRHHVGVDFMMESTRYCSYRDYVEFVVPENSSGRVVENLQDATPGLEIWKKACIQAADAYTALIAGGASPQYARDVLPLSLRCKVRMIVNLNQLLHMMHLRTDRASHPSMRSLMFKLRDEVEKFLPGFLTPEIIEGFNN